MKCIVDGCNNDTQSGNRCSIHQRRGASSRPAITASRTRDSQAGSIMERFGSKTVVAKKIAAKKPSEKKG